MASHPTQMTYSGPSLCGSAKYRAVVTISATVLAVLVPLAMAQSKAVGTIRGKVEDAQGQPVAGATVRLKRNSAEQETQTDKNGDYAFE